LRNILKTIIVYLDDGVTVADLLCMYEDSPDNTIELFYTLGYDVVITIGRHTERESGDGKRIRGIPLRYDAEVPISVTTVNKTDSTAPVTLNKARLAILEALENAAEYGRADVSVRTDEGRNSIIGGHDPLWQDYYLVRIRPLSSLPDIPTTGGASAINPY